jgi:exodeoxyribonuclease VII small subunit
MFWRLSARSGRLQCSFGNTLYNKLQELKNSLAFRFGIGITIERAGATGLVKFEECLERLEKIVQELEKGEVPLEKSLTLFEEGMQLSATCRKQLEEAEGKVEILLKQNGKLQTEPFEPPAEKALRK